MVIVNYVAPYTATTWVQWTVTTNASCTATNVWGAWVDTAVSGAACTNATRVWVRWQDGPCSGYVAVPMVCAPPREYSPEEIEAMRRQAIEAERRRVEEAKRWAEEERKREEDRKAAAKRAEELLVAHLTEEQRADYGKRKRFVVKGGDGASFELSPAWSGNVRELDDKGRAVRSFCIHPRETVPIPDLLLAQKLMLETDPDSFRRIANMTPIHH